MWLVQFALDGSPRIPGVFRFRVSVFLGRKSADDKELWENNASVRPYQSATNSRKMENSRFHLAHIID